MNFTEVVNTVQDIVKRPDKVALIRTQVNKALNLYCTEASFARDRDEQEVTLDSSIFVQSIQLNTFTRLRKVECIKVSYKEKPLDHIDPARLFAQNGYKATDAWYMGGDKINISLSQSSAKCQVSYFKYPPTLTGTDTFWMLDVSPYMIVDRAAALIFGVIGDDASARLHKTLADEAFVIAKRDYEYGAHYG